MAKKRKPKKKVDEEGLMEFLKFHSDRMIKNPTPQELIIRHYLSDLHYNFHTQVPVICSKKYGYILDFVLLDSKIFIEIDGAFHTNKKNLRLDNLRTKRLIKEGYSPLRLTNKQVVVFSKELINQIIQQKLKLLEIAQTSN